MKITFKIDRQGSGLNTTYALELVIEDAMFCPGVDDFVDLRSDSGETLRRMVYKRRFIIDDVSGEPSVIIYADRASALMKQRSEARRTEISKLDLWRAPSEVMSR